MKDDINSLKNDSSIMKDDISFLKNDSTTMKDSIKRLDDDIYTVYTLQQEDHKILQKQTEILNIHTEKLNTLINISNNNQDEHTDFNKRISRLEALIS